jgi:GTP:adenosylcobinamide-phosphate guanylyltransferase
MELVSAIVLAGGRNSPEMLEATGVENRALVQLAPGRTMLDFIIDALKVAGGVRSITVVGDVPALPEVSVAAPGETMLDNIQIGIGAARPAQGERVLIVTSDIPFLTAEAVDDFLRQGLATPADFSYPIIPMDAYNREFAGMRRTTLKLRDGHFTGGNLVLLNPETLSNNRELIMRAYAARKDVLALGRMLGWGLLGRIVVSQLAFPNLLSVSDLELGVARLMGPGSVVKAVVTQFASIGTDIDKPGDVLFARERLKGECVQKPATQ